MEPGRRVMVRKARLDAVVPRLPARLSPAPVLPAQRQILVPGDLAQPHPQLALPPEGVDGLQGPEKGLLGHLLRRVGVPAEGIKSSLGKTTMLTLAVALHNIPEGMAVGAVYAGWLYGDSGITLTGALALSLGIAIQNFPEGAIISMPLKAEGFSKSRSFLHGTLSGAVEPIGAILTILLAGILVPVLPYALSFAAGAMVYVVVEELIPEMSVGKHSNIGTILFAVGFTLMMTLDVALGA